VRTVAHAGVLLVALSQLGAVHRTENFVVVATGDGSAREIAESAESYRKELAIEWLGRELPAWPEPCAIVARVRPELPPDGRTSFEFQRGTAVRWEMSVQGPRQTVLDAVLPHEVAHAVFATHFGGSLPRWIEEGACISAERGESRRHVAGLCQRLLLDKGMIPLERLAVVGEDPSDPLPVYAQANSVTQFLVERGGKQELIRYLEHALKGKDDDPGALLPVHYGFGSLSELEHAWIQWMEDPDAYWMSSGVSPAAGLRVAANQAAAYPFTGRSEVAGTRRVPSAEAETDTADGTRRVPATLQTVNGYATAIRPR